MSDVSALPLLIGERVRHERASAWTLNQLADADLRVSADDLVTHLHRLRPDVQVAQRLLSAP